MTDLVFWVLFAPVASAIFLLFAAYLYSKHVYRYFKKRNIPYEPASFPLGNLFPVFSLKKSYNELLFEMYKKYKGERFVGFFQFFQKSVLIIDRELVKKVLVKDFEYFDGKNIHYNKELEPLTAHLFALDRHEWKQLRTKMSPTFSSGKLKAMFETIANEGVKLTKYMKELIAKDDVLEGKELFTRYGLAVIASTAFGLESDSLSDKSSLFVQMAESIFAPNLDGFFRNGMMFYGKSIAKTLGVRIIPKETHDFFMNVVKDTVQYRENHGTFRNDFLQLMMQLKEGTKIGDQCKEFSITMNELAAQAYVFIIAGYETTSNSMSFFLYEMALNPDIQERVLAEVDAVDEITYDTLAGMEYLDMAIDETLRKHVGLGMLGRVCTKDYVVAGTQHVIEKGTNVMVSVHGMHRDPELYPEPERFMPERFSKENKGSIKSCTYMPFGEGPMSCIGMRLGKLMVKAGLATLMKQFEVRVAPNTPIPVIYSTKTINSTAEGGMWLQFVER